MIVYTIMQNFTNTSMKKDGCCFFYRINSIVKRLLPLESIMLILYAKVVIIPENEREYYETEGFYIN